jgi:hypothetical protein
MLQQPDIDVGKLANFVGVKVPKEGISIRGWIPNNPGLIIEALPNNEMYGDYIVIKTFYDWLGTKKININYNFCEKKENLY